MKRLLMISLFVCLLFTFNIQSNDYLVFTTTCRDATYVKIEPNQIVKVDKDRTLAEIFGETTIKNKKDILPQSDSNK